MEKDEKLVLMLKKKISTSKQHAEHPFTGQNTQHMYQNYLAWDEAVIVKIEFAAQISALLN